MRPQDLIRIKRDGRRMPAEAIAEFIKGVSDGSVPDYQAAALLMAIFWRGLDAEELSHWAHAMLHSGRVLDLSSIAAKKIDKHSTGGVGDKVSICLAPLVAACGVAVPMISGRGLGHTGGTLDKLEAIPGFRTDLNIDAFSKAVEELGICLIGQTSDLAPADRKLYALRDVTSTVESIPLISSSIMSKKLAEGIDGLVLDVKVGSGAFMKDLAQARQLAETLCGIGRRAGKSVTAYLTDMNQPLGREVGNASETREALEILHGKGPDDLWQLTLQLGAEMLVLGERTSDLEEAKALITKVRENGTAVEKMRACIERQGGNPAAVEDFSLLPQAKAKKEICAENSGVLAAVNCEGIGRAAMLLGAGRQKVSDVVDPAVGLTMQIRLGDKVEKGQALATLHYNDANKIAGAETLFRQSCEFSADPVEAPPLIYDVLR